MANDLTDLMNTLILPMALPVLRENLVLPMLVFNDFRNEAAQQNETIRIPGPQSLGDADDMATDIAASGTTSTDLTDDKIDIVMDQWKYKQFQMNDKEMRESLTAGILPSAVESAVKALGNSMGNSLWGLYKDIPYYYGTAGSTPTTATDIAQVRKVLEDNLVPRDGLRRLAIDTSAEAKFLVEFKDADKTGSTEALRRAALGSLFGFDPILADQLTPTHTAGTFSAGAPLVNGTVAAAATTMNIDGGVGTETIKDGDLFTVDGVTGQFVFTADKTASGGAITSATFYPAAPTGGFADDAAITILQSHTPNLAFHRDAFALAVRPLADGDTASSESSTIAVQVDPISNIPLRLETWREAGKATRYWRFDILYGVKTMREELAARLLG